MRNKLIIIVVSLLITIALMSGCENLGNMIFDNIEIELEDQLAVPVGTYTIPYNFSEINSYITNLGLTLTITVVDEEDNTVEVTGNTFNVEEEKVYTVTIVLTNKEGATKSKEIIVRAVSSLDLFTLTFNTDGGSEVFPLEFNYKAELLMPQEPTKEGYIFAGWYIDEELNTPFTLTTMPAENTTLYAKWEAVSD